MRHFMISPSELSAKALQVLMRMIPMELAEPIYYHVFNPLPSFCKGLCRSATLRATDFRMYDLPPSDVIGGAIVLCGFYERDLTRELTRLGRNGGLLIDVGANMGYFSLVWAAQKASNKVIAVEASQRNIERLSKNVRDNGLEGRISIVGAAAGETAGRCEFDPGPPDQSGWGRIRHESTINSSEVDVVTLDSLCQGRRVDVLKIDVEGADTLVLYGCKDLLAQNRIGVIYYEQNMHGMKQLGVKRGDAEAYLRSMDYTVFPRGDEKGDVVEWVARPKQHHRPKLTKQPSPTTKS